MLVLPSAASAPAGVATTVTSLTAARTTSTAATTTIAIAIASAARTTFPRTFRASGTGFNRRDDSIDAVEVRLIIGVEIRAAFDHCCRRAVRGRRRRRAHLSSASISEEAERRRPFLRVALSESPCETA